MKYSIFRRSFGILFLSRRFHRKGLFFCGKGPSRAKNPSKKHLPLKEPPKNLLRSILLHGPLGVYPRNARQGIPKRKGNKIRELTPCEPSREPQESLRPETFKESRKKSPGAGPKNSRKSPKSLEKVSKMAARDFFETFSRLFGTSGPGRLFFRLFGDFGPGGPERLL